MQTSDKNIYLLILKSALCFSCVLLITNLVHISPNVLGYEATHSILESFSVEIILFLLAAVLMRMHESYGSRGLVLYTA